MEEVKLTMDSLGTWLLTVPLNRDQLRDVVMSQRVASGITHAIKMMLNQSCLAHEAKSGVAARCKNVKSVKWFCGSKERDVRAGRTFLQ